MQFVVRKRSSKWLTRFTRNKYIMMNDITKYASEAMT